uniref:Prepro-urotensin II-related peptide 2-L n=1 Tax=Xenopus laevis TaxID=8355 RepID=A0A8G1GKF1_XENLA|nr:prepro-urotensin II-related peptide 2-L [Xenopus laevis]
MNGLAILGLIIATIAFVTRQVRSSPLMGQNQQLSEEVKEETQMEEMEPEQQKIMVTFLALLDKAEKSASSRFAARITGVRANPKLFGKKNRMEELREEHSNPILHLEESVDQTEDLTELNPVRGKHFRKASQSLPRKSKKRACFWKYCIQNK